jgi:MoxR-like ATPase
MRFQVPELAIFSEGGDAPRFGGNLPIGLRPIVIITSNQERPLPDAFLRRCCYHHIRMPDGEGLQKILESRLSEASQLMKPEREAALEFFRGVRNLPGLTRSPGLAELLNWMRYIAFHKGDVARDQAFLVRSLTALIKDPSDAEKVRDWIGRSGT